MPSQPILTKPDNVHVFPTYGREHITDGEPCWCSPEAEVQPNGALVIVHREEN